MWLSLQDPELLPTYRGEPAGPVPAFETLLEALAQIPELADVYAVTSLGRLRFSMAPTFAEESAHSLVRVSVSKNDFGVALYVRGIAEPVSQRGGPIHDLIPVVKHYLMRLLYEP